MQLGAFQGDSLIQSDKHRDKHKKFPGNNTAGRGQTQRHEAAAAPRYSHYLSPCFAATPLDRAGMGQPRGSLSPVPACTRCKYRRADKSQGKTGQRHQER